MRKFTLLLAVCLVSLGFYPALADDAADIARAAKRGVAPTVTQTQTRQRTNTTAPAVSSSSARLTTAASGSATAKSQNTVRDRAASTRDGTVVSSDQSRVASTVVSRTGAIPQTRNQSGGAVVNSTATERSIRANATNSLTSAGTARSGSIVRPTSVGRSAGVPVITSSAARRTTPTNISRSATAAIGTQAADIVNKDYKICRDVFYGCMDEFCANKDTQLKRCACSVRIHDFDNVKKTLSQVEDKILNFNERLLTVNMEKEDALAISQATEGELAFQQPDKSTSKQLLDEIAKKLKTNTSNAELDRNLSAISLSLDTDSAWDDIDSMLGASTTTKEGQALYNAALPVCREMVAEVCDEEGVAIAESGYQMAIEQDCNTVAKAYETMQNQALDRVREGSALLDMSRLDIYQQRNADDILTCKKKMLDTLSESAVCGKDLSKCLDNTGKYIDPSTGEAFLTLNLVNLGTLIRRPTGNQKWIDVPGNNTFVTFLNTKKKYLEPAMENCQDISDQVWDEFIEDALAQIKLAQESKLEDMRQSCTSLTTQCLNNTATSISDFDARALSIFGVAADKTVNEMCSGIKQACTALLESSEGDADWVGGMTEISTDKTYDTILQTCREVGKACIIQTCKSVSGNFGLCESIDNSVNRKAVINRTSCWNEVVKCVDAAGTDSIDRIMEKFGKTPSTTSGDFYSEMYGDGIIRTNSGVSNCNPKNDESCIYDICEDCNSPGQPSCATCRLAERIWGNCEFYPGRRLETAEEQNMIKKTKKDIDTLLYWFAQNTGTSESMEGCRSSQCPVGFTESGSQCISSENVSSDIQECGKDAKFTIGNGKTNCCDDKVNKQDAFGNCCKTDTTRLNGVSLNTVTEYFTPRGSSFMKICSPAGSNATFVASFAGDGDYYKPQHMLGYNYLVCVGGEVVAEEVTAGYPNGQTVKCTGSYVVLNNFAGTYMAPDYNLKAESGQRPRQPQNSYSIDYHGGVRCVLNSKDRVWETYNDNTKEWQQNSSCNWIKSGSDESPDWYPVNQTNALTIDFN